MDLQNVCCLLGVGVTTSRFYCAVISPSRYGSSVKEEFEALVMFGLLWSEIILLIAVVGNAWFDLHIIKGFASLHPFESRWLVWLDVVQIGVASLAFTLLLYSASERNKTITIVNPLMDAAAICVFYAVFYPLVLFLLWLVDLALVRF